MTAALSKQCRERLGAMLALAEGEANPADGERIAALNAVERLLAKCSLRLRDLAASCPVPERKMPEMGTWRETCQRCLERRQMLRPWEVNFVTDMPKFHRISPKQRWILDEIAVRVGVKPARAAA